MRTLLGLTAMLTLGAAGAGTGGEADDPLDRARRAAEAGVFRELDRGEVDRARDLFERTFTAGQISALVPAWAQLGFELAELRDGPRRWWSLSEQPARREGRGFYLVAPGPRRPHLLQAPHSDDDSHTGDLAARLVRSGAFGAAAWNTVSRRQEADGRELDSDLAHRSHTVFVAFTEAWAQTGGSLGIALQLHGYEATKHPSLQADAVVSAGSRRLAQRAGAYGTCLKKGLPGARVALYPDEARELGGTLNEIGKRLRRLGHMGFVHLELDLELRRELIEGERWRVLAECLP